MNKPSTPKRMLHMAAAAAAVATFGVACGDDDGVDDDPMEDPLAPADSGDIDPTVTDPMDDPMTTDPMTTDSMDDPATTDAGG